MLNENNQYGQSQHYSVPHYKNDAPRVENWDTDNFHRSIHFHKEFQITLVREGRGSFFVSDKVVPFKAGEVYLFGKNLPYLLKTTENRKQDSYKCFSAISIFFDEYKIKEALNDIPEACRIQKLIKLSAYGIKVSQNSSGILIDYINQLTLKNGLEKFILLLRLLDVISKDGDMKFLSPYAIPKCAITGEVSKITTALDFIKKNFHEHITLRQIAEIMNMSPTAFCRFFKSKTNKTFLQYIIEVRIGNACRLLIKNDCNIADCCYNSGYNNLSNFQKHFKRITGMSPLEYRISAQSHLSADSNKVCGRSL